jgi:hypothetical protein
MDNSEFGRVLLTASRQSFALARRADGLPALELLAMLAFALLALQI